MLDQELTQDVAVAEPTARVPEIAAGADGIEWFEVARTAADEHRI